MKRERLIRIREFSPRRDVLPYLLAVAGIGLTAATQIWDGLVAILVVTAIAGTNSLRRIEWRGQSLSSIAGDRSIFTEGLRALPHDVITLATIIVTLPAAALTVAVLFQTPWAWLGLAINCLLALAAAIALILEVRRRSGGIEGDPRLR